MFNLSQINNQDFVFFLTIMFVAISSWLIVRKLLKVSFPYFFVGIIGIIVGLTIGSLAAIPFSKLPGNFGRWLPIIVDVFVLVGVLDLFMAQAKTVQSITNRFLSKIKDYEGAVNSSKIIVDTSVIIDGRIESIAKTGFIFGELLIPQFVLNELQTIADSSDSLKRAKGRKGLEILDHLQNSSYVSTVIIDEKTHDKEAVDQKLIKVAKNQNAKILTVDYNLNKIAKIQKIDVLNINELTEAIKPVLIPGENIWVKIIQEGKEPDQGIGYLSDGTMIVVEGGNKYIGQEMECEVVRIFQTVAGKMIFVQPKKKLLRIKK